MGSASKNLWGRLGGKNGSLAPAERRRGLRKEGLLVEEIINTQKGEQAKTAQRCDLSTAKLINQHGARRTKGHCLPSTECQSTRVCSWQEEGKGWGWDNKWKPRGCAALACIRTQMAMGWRWDRRVGRVSGGGEVGSGGLLRGSHCKAAQGNTIRHGSSPIVNRNLPGRDRGRPSLGPHPRPASPRRQWLPSGATCARGAAW